MRADDGEELGHPELVGFVEAGSDQFVVHIFVLAERTDADMHQHEEFLLVGELAVDVFEVSQKVFYENVHAIVQLRQDETDKVDVMR